MNALFDKTIDRLSGFITYRTRKNEVLLSNIANLDTSGFKPSDVEFSSEIKAASARLTKTDSRHMDPGNGNGNYTVVQKDEPVNLDKSMASLAENHLMHNTAIEMLARKFRTIQTVLKESR